MGEIDLSAAVEAGKAAVIGLTPGEFAAAEAAVRAAVPIIERAVREQVVAELRYCDRLNEHAWQANTAHRDPAFRIAADWIAAHPNGLTDA